MANNSSNKKLTVCVTGANGFIAGHIVEQLLAKGHTVRGTVRDPEAERHSWLRELGDESNKVKLYAADLSQPGNFGEAFAGCDVVIHVASVVKMEAENDPFEEIITPSVEGTRNVMRSCEKAKVRKIVQTSSLSAVGLPEAQRLPEFRGKLYTEEEWAEGRDPNKNPYDYSKIESEKLMKNEWKGEYACILPVMVYGPQQHPKITSSNEIIKCIVNREFGPFVPRIFIDSVDVRDVAAAHVWAAENQDVTGRFLVSSGHGYSTTELAESLNRTHPDLDKPFPTRMTPYFLLWLISFFDKRISGDFLETLAKPAVGASNEKIKKAGFEFQFGLDEMMKDTYDSFLKHGICDDEK